MGEKLQAIKSAVSGYFQSAWTAILSYIKGIWVQLTTMGIIVGAIVLIVEYRDILIDLLVNSSKRQVDSAKKEDQELADKENKANNAANALVDAANKLAQTQEQVDDDWNKK